MNIWLILLILFGACLLASSIGFKKFVWFLSIGYGFSVMACGIAMMIIFAIESKLNITGLIACILLVVYGFRLGGFLLIRELKSASYKKAMSKEINTEKKMPIPVLISIWVIVCFLYVWEVGGITFVMYHRDPNAGFFSVGILEIIGLVIMSAGILIEGIADHQKSVQKKENPKAPAMKGLYKICRCPNYYGEILFWTGVVTYAFASVLSNTWWQWVFIALGYICIVYIMFNGAKRLELRQAKNYGENEEFKAYIAKTPIIIYLFIPVKSLKDSKIVK